MRIEFSWAGTEPIETFQERFSPLAADWKMSCRWVDAGRTKRLAVFVSKTEHALFELLLRCRVGDLPAEITMVLSNHPDLADRAALWGVPFHYIPVPAHQKREAEAQQLAQMQGAVDVVVLARYMQIVSPDFIAHYPDNIINIHHSFLPAFAGADPHARAYVRGVKLIGATAHYVTEELDAGPIIEQNVERIDHRHSIEEIKRIGFYIERVVLARAVTWHVEDRVLIHQGRTIVFA